MQLKLQRCTLREFRPGDEESIVLHANNRKIWMNVRDSFPHPYTYSDAKQWIALQGKRKLHLSLAIEIDGKAVGAIGLVFQEDVHRRSAEIGFWLGEEFWGRGVMTEAVKAFTEHAFDHFDLARVYAKVFEWNPGSMRVLEKAGYKYEARLANGATKDGKTIDECLYAIVR